MKFNKKVISILFLVIVVLIFIVDFVFFVDKDQKEKKTQQSEPSEQEVIIEDESKEPTKFEESETEIDKDPLAETKEVTQYLYRNKITPIGNGKEYPSEKTTILKKELMELAEEGKYGEILNREKQLTAEYRFSEGANLDIAGIFHDASRVAKVFREDNPQIFGEAVAQSVTPDMLMVSTFFSDNFARRSIIYDISSLSPIGYESIDIKDSRIYRNAQDAKEEPLFAHRNIVEDIFTFLDHVNAVYVYEVIIDELDGGLPLTVYVWEDLYGTVGFYGMYAPDDVQTYEKSLDWWMQLDPIYEQAEKEQQKNYEQNGENGVITNEQMDQWFESGW